MERQSSTWVLEVWKTMPTGLIQQQSEDKFPSRDWVRRYIVSHFKAAKIEWYDATHHVRVIV